MSVRRKRRLIRKIEFIASWIFLALCLLPLTELGVFLGKSIIGRTENQAETVQSYTVSPESDSVEKCSPAAKPPQIRAEVKAQASAESKLSIAADDTYISDEIQRLCIEIGSQNGYCPELLMSLIEKESGGRQYAENGPCKGIMQINTDWPEIADYMEQHGYTDVYDYETNIRLGCYVLDQKQELYGEDIYAVLMGYNGSSNVMERLENGDYTDYAVSVADRALELERLHGK